MPRIVPSDIIKLIDTSLPRAAEFQETGDPVNLDGLTYSSFLQSLLDLIEQIDDILLAPIAENYPNFLAAQSAIRNILVEWASRGQTRSLKKGVGLPGHPVILIRRLLEKCPDQAIPETIRVLEFMVDEAMREELRQDLASIEFQMHNQQWKAAMVLSGSVAEALILERLQQISADDIQEAIKELRSTNDLTKKPPSDITRWTLTQYVQVAFSLNIVSERTKNLTLIGGDYRNLIHPGKAARENAMCSKAAALSVVASVESIVEDLEAKAGESG